MVMRLKDLPADVQRRMAARGVAPVQRSVQRARGGRRAARAGDAFEARILGSVTVGLVAGAGRLMAPIRLEQLPKCGARFTGRGQSHVLPIPCDFIGCVVSDDAGAGRAVFFDAKHCGDDIASLRLGDPRIVKPHQKRFLLAMAHAGAIAGILVSCRRGVLWLDGKELAGNEPVRWEDYRWKKLGETKGMICFSLLLKEYE